ncbi:MAG: agmatinase [Phycisphaeraceae bacterium]|nr:MAG: agmatinase [Phycisphaeraceae bacterium]
MAPTTVLPNPRVHPRFSGITTFCRYPRLEDVTPENRPVDWAVFGVPFDAGVTYRPGARFGPRAVRDASQYVKRFHMAHGVDVCEVLSLADAGDAPVAPYSCKETLDVVWSWATQLPDPARTRLLAVGGDHSVAYANINATWERRGRPGGGLALLHFDSHLDTVDSVWNEKWGHASPFRRAIEDGLIDPKAMISVGIKGPLNSKADLDFASHHGVTIVTHERWKAEGPRVLRDFVARLSGREAYLSFDIDVVDPAFAPGTGTPCPGGLTSAEAFEAVRACAGASIVGADVVEVLPDRDPAGITALLAAHVVFEILAIDAAARSKGGAKGSPCGQSSPPAR